MAIDWNWRDRLATGSRAVLFLQIITTEITSYESKNG
jgi:hypothetical protein